MRYEFDFKDTFYLSEEDFNEMIRRVKEEGESPEDAVEKVSYGLDDCDYYIFGNVQDKVVEKLKEVLTSAT